MNKTAYENNLDLAILKNAVGHTILDVESLDEEMGKLKVFILNFQNIYLFSSLTNLKKVNLAIQLLM